MAAGARGGLGLAAVCVTPATGGSGTGRGRPVKSWMDPHIELYAPTGTFSYYRVVGYHPATGMRVVNTSGGATRRSADEKVRQVAEQLRAMAAAVPGMDGADPSRRLAHEEAELWLRPENHRTRLNREWTQRHADNMRREWRLRIAPHIPAGTPVAALRDKTLWVRILNDAPRRGAHSPESVQKTGQACRSFVSWLMDRGLLAANPMAGLRYSVSAANNDGLPPQAVTEREIATFDQALDLGLAMAWIAWPQRSSRGGNRRADQVGTLGRGLQPLFVATSAIRSGELFALRADDVDVSGLEVRIREALIEEDSGHRWFSPPKNGNQRVTILAGVLAEDFAEFIDWRRWRTGEHNPLLYTAPMGGLESRSNHSRRFRIAAELAGWPAELQWRGLRHLAAVTMMAAPPDGMGLTLEETSKLLGHHSPEFTARRYLSLRSGWLDRAKTAAAAFRPGHNAGFGERRPDDPGVGLGP